MECAVTEQHAPSDNANTPQKGRIEEIFDKAFPVYLSIGMSREEFWEQSPSLVVAYREADFLRRKEQSRQAWLLGRYFYEALCAASPIFHDFVKSGTKPAPYMDEPIELYRNAAEKDAAEKEKLRRETEAYFRAMMNS